MHSEFFGNPNWITACLILMSTFWWAFLEIGSDRNLFLYCLRQCTTENQLSTSLVDDRIGRHEQHWQNAEINKKKSLFLRLRLLFYDDFFSILRNHKISKVFSFIDYIFPFYATYYVEKSLCSPEACYCSDLIYSQSTRSLGSTCCIHFMRSLSWL